MPGLDSIPQLFVACRGVALQREIFAHAQLFSGYTADMAHAFTPVTGHRAIPIHDHCLSWQALDLQQPVVAAGRCIHRPGAATRTVSIPSRGGCVAHVVGAVGKTNIQASAR